MKNARRMEAARRSLVRGSAARVNAFLASPRMRNRAENTHKAYAYSLGVWLNFLLSTGLN